MIISRITAGLGNQMFQYAAGLALAEARRTVLKLDVSWFSHHSGLEGHNRYALSCFNITEQFATAEEINHVRGPWLTRTGRGVRRVVRTLKLDGMLKQYSRDSHWHHVTWRHFDLRVADLPDNTYLDGLCHAEGYFAGIDGLLRQHFTFRYPATPEIAALATEIASGKSIAVHFRRGDYVRNPVFASELGALGNAYYHRAFAIMREHFPHATFYIFSDDIETVARDMNPPGPHYFVRCIPAWHDHDVLRLMSLCDHAIISNSTFAWWGAWLIRNPDKIVIAPTPWCVSTERNQSHIVPAHWLQVSRDD